MLQIMEVNHVHKNTLDPQLIYHKECEVQNKTAYSELVITQHK